MGITQKLRKGEQVFLLGSHCLELVHIPIKLHEDIMKIVYGWTAPCHNMSFFQKGSIKNSVCAYKSMCIYYIEYNDDDDA